MSERRSRPSDDELSEMLEARADRMPASAAREVMAAVRDEMQPPSGGRGLAPLRVAIHAQSSKAPGWTVVGLVAVLVLAVVGGRLDTRPAASAGPGGSDRVTPAASAGSASQRTSPPPSTAAGTTAPVRLTVDALRAGIADGSLNGRTILVTGRLEVIPWPCPSPLPEGCFGLQIIGLAGIDVTRANLMTDDEALARIRDDTSDRPMAFRVTGNQLQLLGWISKGADTPLTVAGLATMNAAPAAPDVAVVSGWLVTGVRLFDCRLAVGSGECPATAPWLTDARPSGDGMPRDDHVVTVVLGDAVSAQVDAVATQVQDVIITGGPFLVRRTWTNAICDAPAGVDCSGGRWEVVAVLDSGRAFDVQMP